jgi:2-polyprenyl-6-methoxyphenol hydroxylase-like FAD-dependent oxidoreductase
MHVVVIGGGLGGLCLAQGLRQAGCSVALYERDASPSARSQGYRIHVDARGEGALRECLPPRVHELYLSTRGQASTGLTTYSVDGPTLTEGQTFRFPPEGPEGMPRTGRAVDRLTLRETLLAGLDDVVHFGRTFTRHEVTPGGEVRAHFADGTTATGDLLVAADGVGSRVREQHLPDVGLVDTGVRWVGGRTPLDDRLRSLLPGALADRAVALRDRGTILFLAQVLFEQPPDQVAERLWPGLGLTTSGDFLMWGIIGGKDQLRSDLELSAMTGAQLHQVALAAVADGHPVTRAIVESAEPARSFFLAIRATTPVDGWPTGRVTLLGDAIHAGPVNGTGANAALRDAALLYRNLVHAERGAASLQEAVHDYEVEMLRSARATLAATDAFQGRPGALTGPRT